MTLCSSISCLSGFVVLALLAGGCKREEIQVYRVPKETNSLSQSGGAAEASQPTLEWKLPAGWQEVAAGQMRVASFRVDSKEGKQADLGIFALPGTVGHELETVNRWRESVGLAQIDESQMTLQAQKVEVGDQPGRLFEQAGEVVGSGDKVRILAVIVHRENTAWYFKMAGDDEWVAQQKGALLQFLKDLRFVSSAPAGQNEMGGAGSPRRDEQAANSASSSAATAADKPQWEVPAGWQEMGGSQFLIDKFLVGGPDDTQASVNISALAGEGGGLAANINRWRGQLGLASWNEAELKAETQPVTLRGEGGVKVEMSGTDPRTGRKTRLVGVMVPQGGQTWFYKFMGDEVLVEKQKEAFIRFVQSATYPHGF